MNHELKTKADIIHAAFFAKQEIQGRLNEIITGYYDELTDPVYDIDFDYYDNSIEVYFGHYLEIEKLELAFKQVKEYLIKECGFSQGWLNLLDNSEIIFPGNFNRHTPAYNKKRMERYIKEYLGGNVKEENKELLEKWKPKNI